jgi:chromosome segregation ATPase
MAGLLNTFGSLWVVFLILMPIAVVGFAIWRARARITADGLQRHLTALEEKASRVSILEFELAAVRNEIGRLEAERYQAAINAARRAEDAAKALADSRNACDRLQCEVSQSRNQIDAQAATQEDLVRSLASFRQETVEAGKTIEVLRREIGLERKERAGAEEKCRGLSESAAESRQHTLALERALQDRTRELQESRLARIAALQAASARNRQDEAEARNRWEKLEAELQSVEKESAGAEKCQLVSQAPLDDRDGQQSFESRWFVKDPCQTTDQLTRQRAEIADLKKTLEEIGIII